MSADLDRIRRRVFWSMPSGLYIVGVRDGDRTNAMTLNWATQVSRQPVRLGIAVQKEAFTHELLVSAESFTLNLLHRKDRALIRKFVKPVEVDREAMTLNGVAFRDSSTGAPVLTQALAFLDCRTVERLDLGDHTFFVGDVIDANFEKVQADALESGPEVLRMEDTRMNYGG